MSSYLCECQTEWDGCGVERMQREGRSQGDQSDVEEDERFRECVSPIKTSREETQILKGKQARQIDFHFASVDWNAKAWVRTMELVRSEHRQLAGLIVMGELGKTRVKDRRKNHKGFGYDPDETNPYSEMRIWNYRNEVRRSMLHAAGKVCHQIVWGTHKR